MRKKTKIIGFIIGIILFISTIAGFTYAMYRKSLYNVNISGELKNLDEYVIYSKGVNISSGSLMPVSNYTDGSNATITFYKNSNTPYNIYGHIYLDINTMTIPLSHELKYTIVDNSSSNVVSQGSFYTYGTGSSILTAYNIPLNATATTYTVYVWVDEDLYDLNTASSSFDIDIRCYATMKTITSNDYLDIPIPSIHNAANYIHYLYDRSTKSTATVNNITYNLLPSEGLMNDRLASMDTDINGGNIRYFGANPNNYVWLGDSYTENGTEIKKLWRIIGVFDGRLKLISNDPISGNTNLSWDTSATGINSASGINQWGESTYSDTGDPYNGADLMRLLNPGYENESVNNSLYWNKGTGDVYIDQYNRKTNVSFSNTGLSNTEKDMIDTAIWYTGALDDNTTKFVDACYTVERENNNGKLCSGGNNCNDTVVRTNTWSGKVGLMYLSDYGYATDLTTCSQTISNYNTSANSYSCRSKDWLFDSTKSQWTISPHADSYYANEVFFVHDNGNLVITAASYTAAVRPAVFLKSGVTISGGNGSQSDPYVLVLN